MFKKMLVVFVLMFLVGLMSGREVRADCGDNMVLVNGQCECVEGYRDSDGDLSNGCEDLECGANMERDFNWDCVCKSGYADCDGDVSNGCEILGKCNCLDDSDCFWCGADCISGRIDDGRACPEHKGDDSCGCVSGSCGSVGCINNMKMVDGVCVCGEPKGDFNGDGLVDIANDLIGWYTSYRGGGNTKADFNCSGEVDISDLVSWYTNYRSMNNKADLIIESIEIEKIDQPNFPCLGYKYSVLVKNIGNVNANVSRIKTEVSPSQPQRTNNCTDYQLYDGSNAPIPANDLIKEDYLAPGLHELYSDYFNPSEDGTVTIKAIADMNGEVDEKNENNNIMVKTFDVEKTFEIAPTSTPAPTNTPSAIGFADVGVQFVDFPTSLNIGDTFDISMKITNVGNIQTSETITIKLFKKFEAGDSEEISRNVLSVPINPSSFYTWTRTSEEIDDFGFYMYTVTVDMLGEMGNIAPNSASKSFTVYDPDVPTATPASP